MAMSKAIKQIVHANSTVFILFKKTTVGQLLLGSPFFMLVDKTLDPLQPNVHALIQMNIHNTELKN